MSYDSKKERLIFNLNPDKWHPSGCIDPCSQLHNSPLRPSAHGQEIENWLWYVMEMEENELDTEWCGRRAIYIKNYWMDNYAVHCQLKALEHLGLTLCIIQMRCIVGSPKLRGLEVFECKWYYVDTVYWLPIMIICICVQLLSTQWLLECLKGELYGERQRSVNGSQSYPFSNQTAALSHAFKEVVLTILIGKKANDTLLAPSLKWASTEHQWFLVLHLG